MARLFNRNVVLFILAFVCQNQPINSKDTFPISAAEQDQLRISYIGNMGVLIENKDQTVLIDGLHEQYKPAYAHPSDATVASLISGTYSGFTNLELSLYTHVHRDHFSPKLTLEFLEKNNGSLAIGPQQVKEATAKADLANTELLERFRVVEANYALHTIQHQGITVNAIICGHTYQPRHSAIQNIAYLIDINGFTILHIGDSGWGLSEEAFEELELASSNVDVAVLPVWMLMDKSSVAKVRELINPSLLIASHIDPNNVDQAIKTVRTYFPDAVCLSELNEIIKYKK